MNKSSEWLKYFGLARRAGAVIYGIDNILSCRQKINLVILSEFEATQNLKDKVNNFIAKNNTKLIRFSEDINQILGTTNCKVLGITNPELAKQIYSLFNKE